MCHCVDTGQSHNGWYVRSTNRSCEAKEKQIEKQIQDDQTYKITPYWDISYEESKQDAEI